MLGNFPFLPRFETVPFRADLPYSGGIKFDQLRNWLNNPQKGGFAFTEVKTVFLLTVLRSGIIYVFLYRLVFRFLKRLRLVSPYDREH